MNQAQIWFEAMRPKTLPAAVAPVLLGSGLAYADGSFHLIAATICLVFGLLVQIGTNFANDYLDGIKGTDTEERLGPVRAVATGLVAPRVMKRVTIVVLAVAFCVGLCLIPFGGWWLLAVGVASVLCAWLYTGGPYPLAYNGLGDIFVLLFFGFIAVGCTYYVQAGYVSNAACLLGLGCGLLVNNILVVNNYRDEAEDRTAHKRTLVVRLGRMFARMQYLISAMIAGGVLLGLVLYGYSIWVLLGLGPVAWSVCEALRLKQHVTPVEFLGALKASAQIVASYALLVTLALLFGR
jgi:1,4-dihydroxy-2-naphthoate octaprenyltransferase